MLFYDDTTVRYVRWFIFNRLQKLPLNGASLLLLGLSDHVSAVCLVFYFLALGSGVKELDCFIWRLFKGSAAFSGVNCVKHQKLITKFVLPIQYTK